MLCCVRGLTFLSVVGMSSIAFLMNPAPQGPPSQPVPLAVLPTSGNHSESVQRGWDSRCEVTCVCTTFHIENMFQLT